MKFDFVCVGFPKCGTTTLDEILRQHTKIALPVVKETGFFSWYQHYSQPVEQQLKNYYENTDGKKVGVIEPLFLTRASEVKKYFGQDIKILIMMRNPVDRLFSDFRMKLRFGGSTGGYKSLYKKYKVKEVAKMFHDVVEKEIKQTEGNVEAGKGIFVRSNYIKWIREYESIFGKENIKLIFMEDFFADSENELKEIFGFIDVPFEVVDANVRANEGKKISRGYLSATVNKWLYHRLMVTTLRMKANWRVHIRLRNAVESLFKTIGIFTLVDSKEKMLPETRTFLQEYYNDSVRALEQYTNKDLTQIWY